jgi:hypothetical protein
MSGVASGGYFEGRRGVGVESHRVSHSESDDARVVVRILVLQRARVRGRN